MSKSKNTETYEQLRLDRQLCFPIYAASRLITRLYQPLLRELDLTYPQYLVMLILWEEDEVPVKTIGEKLMLNTNTLTPLLKRLEQLGFIERNRGKDDERKVQVRLTEKGKALKKEAAGIPEKLIGSMDFPAEKAGKIKQAMEELIACLK